MSKCRKSRRILNHNIQQPGFLGERCASRKRKGKHSKSWVSLTYLLMILWNGGMGICLIRKYKLLPLPPFLIWFSSSFLNKQGAWQLSGCFHSFHPIFSKLVFLSLPHLLSLFHKTTFIVISLKMSKKLDINNNLIAIDDIAGSKVPISCTFKSYSPIIKC